MLEKAGFKVLETRVYDASRNRAYLQIVAEKNEVIKNVLTSTEPYGDVAAIFKKIKLNMTKRIIKKDTNEV